MVPLCVDLDGTLVKTDTLAESALALVHRRPARAGLLPVWLLRGKAYVKQRVAREVSLNPASLPYNPEVLRFLAEQKKQGRRLVLATGADHSIAQRVADYLGLFDEILASDGQRNLTGATKAQLLVERFGSKGYAYIGDSSTDIPVFQTAREAIPVSPRAQKYTNGTPPLSTAEVPRWKGLARLLRVHQWTKNLLAFVPILAAHNWSDAAGLKRTAYGVVALSLCASAGYLANDLIDLEADRAHPLKRARPLAAGDVPLWLAVALLPLLAVAGLCLASLAGGEFVLALLGYLAATAAYSIWLKRLAILDVLTLAGLYVLRIFAGGITAQVILSPWLIGFSMFLFLSIALAKRCAELLNLETPQDLSLRRRGYSRADFDQLARFGTSSAYLSVLVLALYIQAAETGVLYKRPLWLWGLVPLMIFWTSRLWLEVSRGNMQEDPVLFALKDPASWATLAATALILFLA